ncbi:MAE_28990/MAE_18760 family HEPN-like nuclease [Amycolatopsis sp. YIM 10]|uniref:MAE_28990/MAE_18760 family HEPN-like nuclease n=1 Tax=Amycolatopsis sp. YIM 10 TaxID=2653857 RepID=UPI00128FEA50|nr:MAE_28990/MAE_18760 family HEPN-like nuclease [Amycolatopsis sp. YIM 10]
MNAEDFANHLHRSLAKRKVELTDVRIYIRQLSGGASTGNWAERSAIVLAYAHWEGFVKESSVRYIKLINSRGVRVDRLNLSLQAACLASHFKRAQGSVKIGYLGSILSEMDARRCEVFRLSPEKIVDTESNLSSTAFKGLVIALGLDYLDTYATRQAFIDEKLVHGRNQVAHGEMVSFTSMEAIDRIDGVLVLLQEYTDQLIDAVRDEVFFLLGRRA